MIFSSLLFLFLFLPITLAIYYLQPKAAKNYWLLFASLVFFAWGGVSNTLILILSVLFNYAVGLQIKPQISENKARIWLQFGIGINILLLVVFKYSGLLFSSLGSIFTGIDVAETFPKIALPVGISFYTFHSVSYLTDIYRQKATAQKNLLDMSLYITMFSQLIAGPIIRYAQVENQLRGRKESLNLFASGVERFILGLAKKVLIANVIGKTAETVMQQNPQDFGALSAWIGVICYGIQIYYDFSGYSDMAIGLGRMFGFQFPENFNFPYLANSVQNFWQRWHISLSTFFRDYVYFPLVWNRPGKLKIYTIILIVFLLSGLWHGASWTFLVWGLYHGFFIASEHFLNRKFSFVIWNPFRQFYLNLVILFSWPLFRLADMNNTFQYWKSMMNFRIYDSEIPLLQLHLNTETILTMLVAIFGALGLFQKSNQLLKPVYFRFTSFKFSNFIFDTASGIAYGAVMLYCIVQLASGTFNPFIYYQF